ncbi:MAG: DNA alkylation repair protein [Oscillospiraceae bacterium]|nr:DNA alkylation repair protein [Oscillospiraceae bacterium]
MTEVQRKLFALRDEGNRDFVAKLIPTVDKARILGVRTPALRALARDFAKRPEAADFLKELPHFYLEENGLHAFLIERIRDYDDCVAALDAFLPYVDNWATCDSLSPACFKKHHPRLISDARRWLESDRLYTARFGIGVLMAHFLDGDFAPEYLDWVAAIESEEYYLRMMQAWYFATALAKQYDAALPYLTEHRLEPWTHNKTIQKAVESYRITDEQKAYLKTLRRKK